MSIDISHSCDDCSLSIEADVCLCDKHMDERVSEAYKEGYEEGKADAEAKQS